MSFSLSPADACVYGCRRFSEKQWTALVKRRGTLKEEWRDAVKADCGGAGHCMFYSIAASGSDVSEQKLGQAQIREFLIQVVTETETSLAEFLLSYRVGLEFRTPLRKWDLSDRPAIEAYLRSPDYEGDSITLRFLGRHPFFQQHQIRFVTVNDRFNYKTKEKTLGCEFALTSEDDYSPEIVEQNSRHPTILRYAILYNIQAEKDLTAGHWVLIGLKRPVEEIDQARALVPTGTPVRTIRILSRLDQFPHVMKHQLIRGHLVLSPYTDRALAGGWIHWKMWDSDDAKSPIFRLVESGLGLNDSWKRNWERMTLGQFSPDLPSMNLLSTIAVLLLSEEDLHSRSEVERLRLDIARFLAPTIASLPIEKRSVLTREIERGDLKDDLLIGFRFQHLVYKLREMAATDLAFAENKEVANFESALLQLRLGIVTNSPWDLKQAQSALATGTDPLYGTIDTDNVVLAEHYVNGLSRQWGMNAEKQRLPIQTISILLFEPTRPSDTKEATIASSLELKWIRPRDFERVPLVAQRFIVLFRLRPQDSWSILGRPRDTRYGITSQRILNWSEMPLWILHQLYDWKQLRLAS